MCLIVLAYRVHAEFPLVIGANRDEFYNRPTAEAHFWKQDDHQKERSENLAATRHLILAGKDLEAGGTWMGITTSGRLAAVTNYRQCPDPVIMSKKSRGNLVLGFLESDTPAMEYLQGIQQEAQCYSGFSLVLADATGLYYFCNRAPSTIQKLEPGIYALCNRLLDDPWPKVRRVKQQFAELMQKLESGMPREEIQDELFRILQDKARPPIDELPTKLTGCTQELEELLSSIFIESDFYGTRSSTVLNISTPRIEGQEARRKTVSFTERTYGMHGEYQGTVSETFEIQGA